MCLAEGLDASRSHDANAINWVGAGSADMARSTVDPRSGSGMTERGSGMTRCRSGMTECGTGPDEVRVGDDGVWDGTAEAQVGD